MEEERVCVELPLRTDGKGYRKHPNVTVTEVPVKTGFDGKNIPEASIPKAMEVDTDFKDYGSFYGAHSRMDEVLESNRGLFSSSSATAGAISIPKNTKTALICRWYNYPGAWLFKFKMWRLQWLRT